MKKSILITALLAAAFTASASAVTVSLDSGATWLGYMNVSNLPSDGGAYQFGSGWGVADLNSSFSGPVLTLSPNTIGDPAGYWYIGGGAPGNPGNKIMAASIYTEENTGALSGQSVTFSAEVLSNTFASGYTTTAFIKDFDPGYGSFNSTSLVLSSPGTFSITLATNAGAGRHVQIGFETVGRNVWATDPSLPGLGNIQIGPIPEPTAGLLTGLSLTGLLLRRRRA